MDIDAEGNTLRTYFAKEAAAVPVAASQSPPAVKHVPVAKRRGDLRHEIASIFLPVGYPESVRPEYLRFQLFDTLQAACSYLRNVLTTSALLKVAGVGEEAASPMAAALTWVLRDGFGMFGSLLFSYFAGANFDVHVKEWRLFADLINDVGLTLDMVAPLAGDLASLALALGAACKTICGMVAGATRASITAHFATRGNLADVSAKESAQETAVNLVGLLLGSLCARTLGDSPRMAWGAFFILTLLHVWANVQGVAALTFDFLNIQRGSLVASAWWRSADLSPSAVAAMERIWRPVYTWLRGPRIGVSIRSLVDTRALDGGEAQLRLLDAIFAKQAYVLRVDARGVAQVALRPHASDADVLKALLHCAQLEPSHSGNGDGTKRRPPAARAPNHGLDAKEALALEESLNRCETAWPTFAKALTANGWQAAAVPIVQVGATRVRIGHE
jgi:hypothetical protein